MVTCRRGRWRVTSGRVEKCGKERVTQALQFLIRHRRLANFAVRALARRPAALDALLGVFGDYVPPRALGAALRG